MECAGFFVSSSVCGNIVLLKISWTYYSGSFFVSLSEALFLTLTMRWSFCWSLLLFMRRFYSRLKLLLRLYMATAGVRNKLGLCIYVIFLLFDFPPQHSPSFCQEGPYETLHNLLMGECQCEYRTETFKIRGRLC